MKNLTSCRVNDIEKAGIGANIFGDNEKWSRLWQMSRNGHVYMWIGYEFYLDKSPRFSGNALTSCRTAA